MRAYGGPQFQVLEKLVTRFADAIQTSKVDIVPRVLIGAGGGQGDGKGLQSGGLLEGLVALILSDRLGLAVAGDDRPRDVTVLRLREELKARVETRSER